MRLLLICKGALISALALGLTASSESQAKVNNLFDVSSVKPAVNRDGPGAIRRLDSGTVSVSSMTVYDMIELFYSVKPYQISGGPEWSRRERFDVTGKDSTAGSKERAMKDASPAGLQPQYEPMRQLLKDRFQLEMHHEVRHLPALMLLVDGKKKFTQSPCSSEYRLQHGVVKGAIHVASLVALLKVEYGMPVNDGTGLDGCYAIDTRWTTDPADESLPSIETALGDLGFRLKKVTGDVDMLIIDQLERPHLD